ncbi:MAG TPA: WD40 repeat domain-containing protein, partial [Planctomycetota bacterium]|nr:WD40 repeat domain-containing protein [Planctomycetota bacterium]
MAAALLAVSSCTGVIQPRLKPGDQTPGAVVLKNSPSDEGEIPSGPAGCLGVPYLRHDNRVTSVKFHPDGNTLISGGDGMTRFWDLKTGREMKRWKGWGGSPVAINGSTLLMDAYGRAYVYDLDSGKRGLCISTPNRVHAMALHVGAKRAAMGGADESTGSDVFLKLYDLETGKELSDLKGHSGDVTGAIFSPDGLTLYSSSADQTIRAWDVRAGKEIRSIETGSPIRALDLSPDGKRLATAEDRDEASKVRIWDAATGAEVKSLELSNTVVGCVAWSGDGETIAAATGNRTGLDTRHRIRVWSTSTWKERCTIERTHHTTGIALSQDGKLVATAGYGCRVRLWDVSTGHPKHETGPGHDADVSSIAVSEDDRILASGSEDGTVRIWDVLSRKQILKLDGPQIGVHTV